jgi:environmental stress-induced protein Ves
MSVAEITRDGPFSQFDDVQRWFAVLAGAGVRLQLGDITHALTASSPPFGFEGASAPNCELVAGPTEDFNLMLKKGCVGHMERVSGELVSEGQAGDLIAVYTGEAAAAAWVGPARTGLTARTLAWRILAADAVLRLESPNALWMEIEP